MRRLGPVRRFLLRRPVVMDAMVAALFAVPALLTGIVMLTIVEPPEERWRGAVVVAVAVLGSLLLMRRRHEPLRIAIGIAVLCVVNLALAADPGAVDVAMVLAVYAVAVAHRQRIAWAVLGGNAVVYAVAATFLLPGGALSSLPERAVRVTTDGAETVAAAPAVTLLVISMLIALAIGTSVRARRQHESDLIGRANALSRDRDQRAQLAVAAERTRIAREMHDVVAHSLTVMVALAEGAKAAGPRDPDAASRALDALGETGRSALDDMRRVLGVLREPDSDAPLEPERAVPLEELAERFRAAGLPVRLVLSGALPPEGTPVRDAADRIVQESLTNVLRYAPGTGLVLVELNRRDERPGGGDWLEVLVVDEGPGAVHGRPGPLGTGRGIVGMRERAALHGGALSAGPDGAGWRVHVTLRLDAPREGGS